MRKVAALLLLGSAISAVVSAESFVAYHRLCCLAEDPGKFELPAGSKLRFVFPKAVGRLHNNGCEARFGIGLSVPKAQNPELPKAPFSVEWPHASSTPQWSFEKTEHLDGEDDPKLSDADCIAIRVIGEIKKPKVPPAKGDFAHDVFKYISDARPNVHLESGRATWKDGHVVHYEPSESREYEYTSAFIPDDGGDSHGMTRRYLAKMYLSSQEYSEPVLIVLGKARSRSRSKSRDRSTRRRSNSGSRQRKTSLSADGELSPTLKESVTAQESGGLAEVVGGRSSDDDDESPDYLQNWKLERLGKRTPSPRRGSVGPGEAPVGWYQ